MKKKYIFLLTLIVLLNFTSCGGISKSAAVKEDSYSGSVANKSVAKDVFSENAISENKSNISDSGANPDTKATNETSTTTNVQNAILAQRKVIRNANISIEVTDFTSSYTKIKNLISSFGYIQDTNIRKEKEYDQNNVEYQVTKGTITLRIDKDKFDSTLSDIKGVGQLISESIKSDDVTDKFFDTESRLRLLKFEESRLEEYLKKVTDPEVIFKTESRLTTIRQETEGLTGRINKWNDLVALSTITLDIQEKSKLPKKVEKPKSFFSKITSTFGDSLTFTTDFLSNLLLFLIAVFPPFLVIFVIGYAIYKVVKIIRKKIKANKNK